MTIKKQRQLLTKKETKNNKQSSKKQVNNPKIDETMITVDDTGDKNNQISLMRKIEHGTDIMFKNNKYTTPITFEFTVSRDNRQVNIFDRHKKVFEATKLVNNTIKMITTAGKVFGHPKEIPSGQKYVTHFPFINCIQNSARFSSVATWNRNYG